MFVISDFSGCQLKSKILLVLRHLVITSREGGTPTLPGIIVMFTKATF